MAFFLVEWGRNMLNTLSIVLLTALPALGPQALAQTPNAGNVRFCGSTSVANAVLLPHEAAIEAAAGVLIDIVPSSSGAGIIEILAERCDVAMISSSLEALTAEMSHAIERLRADPTNLYLLEVGHANIDFIVHKANPVQRLSAQKLMDIYDGSVQGWSEIGGPDVPVLPISESRHGAMRAILEAQLLKGRKISDHVVETTTAPQVAEWVARSPGAIGFVSSTLPESARHGTSTLATDVHLVQPLVLVTVGQPSGAAARVIEAIRGVH